MNQASNRYQAPLSSHIKMELLARSVLQVPCLADDTLRSKPEITFAALDSDGTITIDPSK